MKVVGIYAVKGGVGKTAAAVNLAWLAAHTGHRTLLWDLDSQAAATFLLRGRTKVKGGTAALLRGKTEAVKAIRATPDERLDLLPADPSYTSTDIDLDGAKRSRERLSRILSGLKADYDIAFLDCPAGMSLLSTNVMRAADLVMVPIVPSPLSLRTLDQVVDLAARVGGEVEVVAFLSMVERRRALHRDVVHLLHGRYADVARTVIPNSAMVERMGQRRRPIVATAPNALVSLAYVELWQEAAERVGLAATGEPTS